MTWQDLTVAIVVAFIVIQILWAIKDLMLAVLLLAFAGIAWVVLTPFVWLERRKRGSH